MSNPLKLRKAKAVQLHRTDWGRKWETIPRGNFFWKGRVNFMADGVCFVPYLLWNEFVPVYGSKILLFCSKSLKQWTLRGGKRSNFVPVAVKFEISLLYHQNQTESVPYAGVSTDSQDTDRHRCSWFTVGGLGVGMFFICLFLYCISERSKEFFVKICPPFCLNFSIHPKWNYLEI